MIFPWSYNAAQNPDNEIHWLQYDHTVCYMIELFFRRYKAGDVSYQQIPIPGLYVLDFKFMKQISILDPGKQRQV